TYAASRALGGGAIGTQSHELDYALWLFGAPSRVYASGGHLSDLEIDVEDVASIHLECGGRDRLVPVTVHLDYLRRPPVRRLDVVGTAGTLRCDLLTATVELTDTRSGRTDKITWPSFERNDMYLDMLRAFLRATRGEE